MWVAAAFSAISAISTIIGGKKAAEGAKKQGAIEARLEARVTQEKLRQMRVEEGVMRGETLAQAAGSGIKATTGSPLMVLAEQAREFARQREATLQAGATKISAIGQHASNVANQARYGSYSAAADQFSRMFELNSYGSAASRYSSLLQGGVKG